MPTRSPSLIRSVYVWTSADEHADNSQAAEADREHDAQQEKRCAQTVPERTQKHDPSANAQAQGHAP
jgi:hypothetical protein